VRIRCLTLLALLTSGLFAVSVSFADGAKEQDPEEPDHPAPSASKTAAMVHILVPEKEGMLLLPGGTFTMGSNDPKSADFERPSHLVILKPFWIDRLEVSVKDYKTCALERACTDPQKTSAECSYQMGDPLLPVSCVRFAQAQNYCRVRGKRLPREAEWEFAARGTQMLRYPWGSPKPNCFFAATVKHETTGVSCTEGRPARTGSYPSGASPFGVLDLAGNVEEWTDDVFRFPVPAFPATATPLGSAIAGGENHVLRGGSWMMPPRLARTTSRNWGSDTEAGPGTGFRCAKDPEAPRP
jgi:formylglycine-generating enzyme required for sulfatase activity